MPLRGVELPARDSMLPKVQIATPCPADWNKMVGDDKVRFCSQCNLNVYNLSAMTEPEVLKILERREGRLCAHIYQRADGTILTQDCPAGVRARLRRITRYATAALFAVFAAPMLHAQSAAKTQTARIQSDRAELTVRVTDMIGAVVAGAQVEAIVDGKVIREGKTGREGQIQFVDLPAGVYDITVSSPGFQKLSLPLRVKAHLGIRLQATLDVGVMMGVVVVSDDLLEPLPVVPSVPQQQIPMRSPGTPRSR